MVSIYILKLENKKYYIGKTNNPNFRINDHFNNRGSFWTKTHKPLELVEFIKNCDEYDEDKYTIIYMNKYGIENTRGGSFSSICLDNSTINHLTKMLRSANNACFICGKTGHFEKECTECDEIYMCSYCEKEFDKEVDCDFHVKSCNPVKKSFWDFFACKRMC